MLLISNALLILARDRALKLKLTGQPFEVLSILLERPGEVVTREELQKRLWPDTFVDVDHNLNTAINKIREVLGDSAENPKFVETLPRRGYRFIAPVDVDAGLTHSQQGVPQVPQGVTLPPQSEGGDAAREPLLQRHRVLGLSCAAIIVIAVLSYWLTRPLMPPKVSGYTRITNDGRAKKFRVDAFPVIVTDGL
jgi:DNA-binding winged helix-turn-helix (wHTH) protein